MASLSVEPCPGASLIASAFDVPNDDMMDENGVPSRAFLEREEAFEIREVPYVDIIEKSIYKHHSAASVASLDVSTTTSDDVTESKKQMGDDIHDANDASGEPYIENEPESLRRLHASVTHPYDPHFPNDYLAYRERKKTEQVRKDLQRSALQRLDQQEKMRKKIEEDPAQPRFIKTVRGVGYTFAAEVTGI